MAHDAEQRGAVTALAGRAAEEGWAPWALPDLKAGFAWALGAPPAQSKQDRSVETRSVLCHGRR